MADLAFFHRYFHFSRPQWEAWLERLGRLCPESDEARWPAVPFRRRALRYDFPAHYAAAYAHHRAELERETAEGVRTIRFDEPAYPEALNSFIPPERRPSLLYLRGGHIPLEEDCVAMVGTRAPSANGLRWTREFASYFTMLEVKVVSGLAMGVDGEAHRANVSAGTVAVLGSECLDVYPATHRSLAEEIVAMGGTIVTPYPLGQVPLPVNFPQRNEIIAALSAGTLVVEGGERSGASVTARQCLSMGKTVVALPQDFRTAAGRGALRLVQSGAVPCANEEECLQALFARLGGFRPRRLLDPGDLPQSFTFADFQTALARPLPETLALLEECVISGRVRRLGTDRYRLRGLGR